MTDISNNDPTPPTPGRRTRGKHVRRHIKMPDGDTLEPRAELAEELGMSEKSLKKLDPPTTYLSNVAYCLRGKTLQIVADRIRRRNEPPTRRRNKTPKS